MPELPDVETMKRYIDSTALHKTVRRVDVLSAQVLEGVSAKKFSERLTGRKLSDSRRHGKYLGVQLDSGNWLVLHFGMTGSLKYYKDGEAPQHARFILDLTNGYHLAYISQRQLGRNRIVKDFVSFIERNELGIDALDEKLTLERFRELVSGRRGTLKGLLMNQEVIAGLGNEYADEILFQVGLRPDTKTENLDDAGVKKMYRTMKRVLAKAIERNADVTTYPKTWILPNREEGKPCPRCRTPIKTMKVSGRTTYFCPGCQR